MGLPRKRSQWVELGVAAGLLAVIGACTAISSAGGGDQSAYVKVACRDWVKERLKSPASAEFSDESVERDGDDGYVVSGAVDSQNGFGAMIRNTYTCEATHSGETTRLVSLTGLR